MDTTTLESPVTQPNHLREIRQARGLTLRQIAEATGIHFQQIHRGEGRTDALTPSKWIRIAEFLETPLNELL